MKTWIDALASSSPTPGGGGAAALVGALSSALCSMVGNLTTGKKAYAVYQSDIERILKSSERLQERLYHLIQEDAAAFEPLSAAYKIPKDDPKRSSVMEPALVNAANAPMNILLCLAEIPSLLEELETKGSKYAVSDIGCSASLCQSAAECAFMNVAVNTKLMENKEVAVRMYQEAKALNEKIALACSSVKNRVERMYEL